MTKSLILIASIAFGLPGILIATGVFNWSNGLSWMILLLLIMGWIDYAIAGRR